MLEAVQTSGKSQKLWLIVLLGSRSLPLGTDEVSNDIDATQFDSPRHSNMDDAGQVQDASLVAAVSCC